MLDNDKELIRNVYDFELLTILMEECAEVIQAASKIQRFGWDSEWKGETGREILERELGDLQCMVDLLHEGDHVSFTAMDEHASNKHDKLRQWSNLIE